VAAEQWLLDRIVISPLSSIRKSDLKLEYEKFCKDNNLRTVVHSTLGNKLMKLFPVVQTGRAGGRKKSDYSYFGIAWKEDQQNVCSSENFDLGITLSCLKTSNFTLKHCPKGARREVAFLLAELIDNVVTGNSTDSWQKLLLFPHLFLAKPNEEDEVKNLTTWVKRKVSNAPQQNLTALQAQIGRNPKPRLRPANVSKRIESKLADGDTRGAIRLLNSEDSFAPNDASTLQALIDKHHSHPLPTDYPDSPEPVLTTFLEAEVQKCILSFPIGSAGGLDALRPQIIKELISQQTGDAGRKLISSITNLSNFLVNDATPEAIRCILFGASLTVLSKKKGGIRPIAVGNVWRRLTSKLVTNRITPSLATLLSPIQVGVGIQGGAEAISHAGRIYYTSKPNSPKVLLKLDFANAFNDLRRDSMLHQVKLNIPTFFHYISQSYQSDSNLYFGQSLVKSQRGVQQGDPLGPALFALTIHPLAASIDTEFNGWFLDDGSIGDDPEVVFNALKKIKEESTELGLELNLSKCEFCVIGGNSQVRDNIKRSFLDFAPELSIFDEENAEFLGAPLTPPSIRRVLMLKTEAFRMMSSRLTLLSAHAAFYLLRLSVSTPRLIYFLRCAPSFREKDLVCLYDQAFKSVLEDVLNLKLSEDAWKQSALPVDMGGLGIRHAVDSATFCFLASFHSSKNLIDQILPARLTSISDESIEDAIQDWTGEGFTIPSSADCQVQRKWEEQVFNLRATSHVEDSQDDKEKLARILAAASPHSGDWLKTLPSPQLGTHLSNETFRIAAALRIGGDVCTPHTCPCGAAVTSDGHHGLSCMKSAGRLSRHGAINDVIQRALKTAEIPTIKEPSGCSRSDGKKPDGLTLIPWKSGKCLIWDFSCRDTFAPSYVKGSAARAGHVATLTEIDKHKLYEQLTQRFVLVAVAVETAGTWGKEGLVFIKNVGQRIKEVTGERRATSYLLQRISVALQRGNAASILGTLPSGKELDEIFYF